MLSLILSVALAACPTVYGIQNPGGDWNFSIKQEPGMVVVAGVCIEDVHYADLALSKGKYIVDSNKKAARLAAEKTKQDLAKVKDERFKALAEKVMSDSASVEEKDEALKLLLERVK